MNPPHTLSRREFAALSVAAGVAAVTGAAAASPAAGSSAAAGAGTAAAAGPGDTVDSDVEIETADGRCEAAFIRPKTGAWPAVMLFTDVFGVRPTMRQVATRLAAHGYTVLVPNLFYRTSKVPCLSTDIDFNHSANRAKIDALREPLTADAVMRDANAFVHFLDSQSSVNAKAAMGVLGYCTGGAMTLRAAAALPGRIGAGASFHGGGLVTDKPDSPHLLVPKIRAQFYFGIAMNDDRRQPDAKSRLRDAFQAARLRAKIDVYEECLHGWCVKDMPTPPGKPPIYDAPQAERAWGEVLNLYHRAQA